MKILLLGATGRTGKLILETALQKGHEINCLVRKPEQIRERTGLKVFKGNANNINDLLKAIEDCKSIITALNISRNSDFPWSKLRTPGNYLSDVAGKLVPIGEEKKVRRIVVCSAWGVAETKDDIPKWFKWFIENSNIGITYKDHERQEELLRKSNLNWTIVRPTGLTNSKNHQKIKETFGKIPKPGLTISRASVANYMLNSIDDNNLIKKVVVISKE